MLPIVIATVGLVAPLVVLAKEPHPARSPLPYLLFAYFIGTVAHAVYWVLAAGQPPSTDLVLSNRSGWVTAIAIQAVWMLGVVLVYLLTNRSISDSPSLDPNSNVRTSSRDFRWANSMPIVVALIVCLILFGTVLLLRESGVNTLSDLIARPIAKRRVLAENGQLTVGGIMRALTLVGQPFVVALFVTVRRYPHLGTRVARRAIIAILAVTIASGLVLGSRSQAFTVLVMMMVIAIWTATRVPLRKIGLGVVAIAILVSVAGSVRSVGNQQASAVITGPVDALETFVSGTSGLNAAKLAAVRAAVPEPVPYANGETYLSSLVEPIPRAVWKEKPRVRIGVAYGQALFGLDEDRHTGRPPGLLGEAYLNFGVVGLGISAAVMGWVLGWVRRRAIRLESLSIAGISATVIVVVHTCLALPTGDFAGFWFPTIRDVVVAWAATRMTLRAVESRTSAGRIIGTPSVRGSSHRFSDRKMG